MDISDFEKAKIAEYHNGIYRKTVDGHVKMIDVMSESDWFMLWEVIIEPITFDEDGFVEYYETVGCVAGTRGICGYNQKRPESEGGGEDMITFEVLEIEY